jgi:hypothetical protein
MATKKINKVEEQVEKKETKFTKEQLLASQKFRGKKDLLVALLKDQKLYTPSEVDELIEKYEKTEVK